MESCLAGFVGSFQVDKVGKASQAEDTTCTKAGEQGMGCLIAYGSCLGSLDFLCPMSLPEYQRPHISSAKNYQKDQRKEGSCIVILSLTISCSLRGYD